MYKLTVGDEEFDIDKMIEGADPDQLLEIAKMLKRLVPILQNEEAKKVLASQLKEFQKLKDKIEAMEKSRVVVGKRKSEPGQDEGFADEEEKKWPSIQVG